MELIRYLKVYEGNDGKTRIVDYNKKDGYFHGVMYGKDFQKPLTAEELMEELK